MRKEDKDFSGKEFRRSHLSEYSTLRDGVNNKRRVLLCLCFLILLLSVGLVCPYKSYGKIQLPIKIDFKLTQPARPSKPLTLKVAATSRVPFTTGRIILAIPPIGTEPSREIELWSGGSDTPATKTLEHITPALEVGEYRFIVIFEITPQRAGVRTMRVVKKLFVDVRTHAVFSSNVSFTQIKRIELKKELERRGLSNLPDAQLKSLAPDILKKIKELNKLEVVKEPSVPSTDKTIRKKVKEEQSNANQKSFSEPLPSVKPPETNITNEEKGKGY